MAPELIPFDILRSTCSRRVLVVAHEFGGPEGQAWEFKPVEFTAIKSPEWLLVSYLLPLAGFAVG